MTMAGLQDQIDMTANGNGVASEEQLHQRIMSMLGSDPAALESLFSQLTLNDNTKKLKDAAQQVLKACTNMGQGHSDALLLKLLHVLCFSEARESRTLVVAVLRKQIPSAWPRLSASARSCVKESLFHSFQQEQSRDIFIKVCCAISDLMACFICSREGSNGNADYDEEYKQQLLSFVLTQLYSSSSSIRQKEGALIIFSHLMDHCSYNATRCTDFLAVPEIQKLHGFMKEVLMSPMDVLMEDATLIEDYVHLKLAAISVTSNYVQANDVDDSSLSTEVEHFQDLLLTGAIQIISQLALHDVSQTKDAPHLHTLQAGAQKALEVLIEVVEMEPDFVMKRLEDVVDVAFKVSECQLLNLEDATRQSAIELLLVCLEKAREPASDSASDPAAKRQHEDLLPRLIRRLFSTLLCMLLDVVDDPVWHSAENDVDFQNAGESSNFQSGQEFLDRLAEVAGGRDLWPIAQELLSGYIADNDWRKRHAALISIAQISEGCAKAMTKNPEPIVNMVLNAVQDTNPKVRWAAINAIGQMATDLDPLLQDKFHHRVVPCLLEAMDDTHNPRIQAHGAAAMLNFAENCKAETLVTYLDGIVNKLVFLLQTEKAVVLEDALTALAAVAESTQAQFQTLYENVMPHLKAIFMDERGKYSKQLRLKSMQCITLVGLVVGKDKFGKDAKDVLDALLSLHNSKSQQMVKDEVQSLKDVDDEDDFTITCMLQAWARLCECFGTKEFLPHMNIIMPLVLQSAQLKLDVTITDNEEYDEEDEVCQLEINEAGDSEDSDYSAETITVGDKTIKIRTTMLEEKASACSLLYSCALELKQEFYPWIDQAAAALVPLLKFYFNEEVRESAIAAMPELLNAAKLSLEKGIAVGKDESYLRQLSNFIIPALVDSLHKELDIKIMLSILDSINQCIQVAGFLLNDEHRKVLVDELKHVITTKCNKKESVKYSFEEYSSSEEEFEELLEEEILNQVGECFTSLIMVFKDSILSVLEDSVMPMIITMMGKDDAPQEKELAICIFGALAEQCELPRKYYDTFLRSLLEGSTNDNPDVRQAAIDALGVCAEFGSTAFEPVAKEAFDKLRDIISQPKTENEASIESAVSALGKICLFQSQHIDSAQGLSLLLTCLPLKDNIAQAKHLHEQLCSVLERAGPGLGDLNTDCISKVFGIIAKILRAGNELTSDDTLTRIENLIRQMKQTLSPAKFSNAWSCLQLEHQAVLQSINLSP